MKKIIALLTAITLIGSTTATLVSCNNGFNNNNDENNPEDPEKPEVPVDPEVPEEPEVPSDTEFQLTLEEYIELFKKENDDFVFKNEIIVLSGGLSLTEYKKDYDYRYDQLKDMWNEEGFYSSKQLFFSSNILYNAFGNNFFKGTLKEINSYYKYNNFDWNQSNSIYVSITKEGSKSFLKHNEKLLKEYFQDKLIDVDNEKFQEEFVITNKVKINYQID